MPLSVSLAALHTELLLAIGAMVLLMLGAFRVLRSDTIQMIAIMLLGLGVIFVLQWDYKSVDAFGGSFRNDAFSRFMKILALGSAAITLAMSTDYFIRERIMRFEFPILVLLATVGMTAMISANDLIALYMALELMSLSLYVIASFHRDDARSTEAGLKYFVLGALSSGMLLYGCSLIYGYTGTVAFTGIADAVKDGHAGLGLVFGIVFLLVGLAFKISAVPFHMWTPDVYEGAPTPVTAFFAAAPKAAAMALFLRVMMEGFPGAAAQWKQIVVFISVGSMLLGAFAAIGQTNIKRLMAYSSIGHMGFALVGLAAASVNGVQGVLIYMAIYMVMTIGTFAVILSMRRNGEHVETIGDLAGLSRTNPLMAFALAMLMFSLAGIPPLAGFFAKWHVFLAIIEAKLYVMAVIGVLASVIGAYYYLRIVKIMYFDEPAAAFEVPSLLQKLIYGAAAVLVLVYFVYPSPLVNAAGTAARSLF